MPTEATLYPVSRLPDAAVCEMTPVADVSSEVAALAEPIAALFKGLHSPLRNLMPGMHAAHALGPSQSMHPVEQTMQRPSVVEPYCPMGQKGPHGPKVVLDGR